MATFFAGYERTLEEDFAGLVVDVPYRRRGIGAALVRAIEQLAAEARIDTLYLYTSEQRSFYEALDWKEVETFEQDGEAMMLMSRSLFHILPAT